MGTSTLKHFDYLTEHASELESALDLVSLKKKVDHWRRSDMDEPDAVLVGCRKFVELALKRLLAPLPEGHMRLSEIIDYAEDEKIIDRAMALKCHEIRRKGNLGAHALTVKAVDAQMALDLLDDFLRWSAENLQIIPIHSGSDVAEDPIFIIRSVEQVEEVAKKARIASALGNDKTVERKARKAKTDIKALEEAHMSDLQKMEDLVQQAQKLGISITRNQDEEAHAVQQRLFDGFNHKIEELSNESRTAGERLDEVNAEATEILNEHDFIRKLLGEGAQATIEQHDVMAFPRGSNSVTNILQIAGGAGTGKTLCLLAKLISEVDNHGQGSLYPELKKSALFICFNKGLANYVRSILQGYDDAHLNINVESYDEFINQLVRTRPKKGYEHLAGYATDARYTGFRIIYSSNDEYAALLQDAQETVAVQYPDRVKEYYLDSSDAEGFEWVKDELQWIEARFEDEQAAIEDYPKARRVGRGTRHQPNERIRKIILEIWTEFNRLLAKNRRYTIDQATKRLLCSNSLPSYDAIAIDEVQDFSLLSIKLLLRFRRSDTAKVFLSGDENQKIYQRDFTWKELDEGLKGRTITLRKNMRNTSAIRHFSGRLIGAECPHDAAKDMVHIVDADDARTVELLRKLTDPRLNQTAALITGKQREWEELLRSEGIPFSRKPAGDILSPGLYILGNLKGKGLEFDNVIVDYIQEFSEDEDEEKRLRYVHFTRARKRLYIRYQHTPPKLISKYYADFLG